MKGLAKSCRLVVVIVGYLHVSRTAISVSMLLCRINFFFKEEEKKRKGKKGEATSSDTGHGWTHVTVWNEAFLPSFWFLGIYPVCLLRN